MLPFTEMMSLDFIRYFYIEILFKSPHPKENTILGFGFCMKLSFFLVLSKYQLFTCVFIIQIKYGVLETSY